MSKAILQALARTVRSTVSGESSQSDPLRFRRTRRGRKASVSEGSTEDVASVTCTRAEGSPSTRAGSASVCDGFPASGADVEGEVGQDEGGLSSPSVRHPSLSPRSPPSRVSTPGAQAQACEPGQVPSWSLGRPEDATSVFGEQNAPADEEWKQSQSHDLSPTQADTDVDVAGSQESRRLAQHDKDPKPQC